LLAARAAPRLALGCPPNAETLTYLPWLYLLRPPRHGVERDNMREEQRDEYLRERSKLKRLEELAQVSKK